MPLNLKQPNKNTIINEYKVYWPFERVTRSWKKAKMFPNHPKWVLSSCKSLKNFNFLSTQDTSIKSYKIKMYVHSIVTKRMILYVYTLRCIINLLKLKTQNWFKTKRNLGIRRLLHNFSSSVLWPHFRQMKHTAH